VTGSGVGVGVYSWLHELQEQVNALIESNSSDEAALNDLIAQIRELKAKIEASE